MLFVHLSVLDVLRSSCGSVMDIYEDYAILYLVKLRHHFMYYTYGTILPKTKEGGRQCGSALVS